jgi:D-alanine-D-alanine ligase
MDEKGRFYFLECNPLPGLTPGWSDLVLISQGGGMDYRTLIGEILSGAIRRYKEREQRKNGNGAPKSGYEERATVVSPDPLRLEAKA